MKTTDNNHLRTKWHIQFCQKITFCLLYHKKIKIHLVFGFIWYLTVVLIADLGACLCLVGQYTRQYSQSTTKSLWYHHTCLLHLF
jgi:hypothetical protein